QEVEKRSRRNLREGQARGVEADLLLVQIADRLHDVQVLQPGARRLVLQAERFAGRVELVDLAQSANDDGPLDVQLGQRLVEIGNGNAQSGRVLRARGAAGPGVEDRDEILHRFEYALVAARRDAERSEEHT